MPYLLFIWFLIVAAWGKQLVQLAIFLFNLPGKLFQTVASSVSESYTEKHQQETDSWLYGFLDGLNVFDAILVVYVFLFALIGRENYKYMPGFVWFTFFLTWAASMLVRHLFHNGKLTFDGRRSTYTPKKEEETVILKKAFSDTYQAPPVDSTNFNRFNFTPRKLEPEVRMAGQYISAHGGLYVVLKDAILFEKDGVQFYKSIAKSYYCEAPGYSKWFDKTRYYDVYWNIPEDRYVIWKEPNKVEIGGYYRYMSCGDCVWATKNDSPQPVDSFIVQ